MMLLSAMQKHHQFGGTHRYKAFGLHIVSDCRVPELLPDDELRTQPEVIISIGKVPLSISCPIQQSRLYQAKKDEYLLRVPDVGGFYVTNGNRIIVEPWGQPDERLVRYFLLGAALNALLLQRGVMLMHASAVAYGGCCVIFTGESGAGKSTLSAAFRKHGYPILTDDVAAMVVDGNGVFHVQPGYPHQKLSRDSAAATGIDVSSDLPAYSSSEGDKCFVSAHEGFCQSSMPVGAIYELKIGNSQNTALDRLSFVESLTIVLNGTFCKVTDVFGGRKGHFEFCVDLAKRIPVSRLSRPEGMFSLADQMQLVQNDLHHLLEPAKRDSNPEVNLKKSEGLAVSGIFGGPFGIKSGYQFG